MISYNEFEDIIVNVLKRDISSNMDQRNAILSEPDKSLFIVAGPGSGKTTVMVLKILKYIFVDDIDPGEIIATTFTRKAASELYSRILGWGDAVKNHLIEQNDDDFELFGKIGRIDFNQIKIGTTDSISEELLMENKKRVQPLFHWAKRTFGMVEIRGVEPLTFSVPLRRSTN